MLMLLSCRDEQWKQHNKLSEEGVGKNLLEVVKSNSNWSKFYEALELTGYGEVLEQSNNLTVFAPDNSAWDSVSMEDITTLKRIVAGQIAYGKHLSSERSLYEPMRMLNSKVISYDNVEHFNGAEIQSPDHLASNGVIHAMNTLVRVKSNIWEYLTSAYSSYEQVKFITSLTASVMDPLKSKDNGVYPNGDPKYDTVFMEVNPFLDRIPLNREDTIMTYVVLADIGYNALLSKFRTFFRTRAAAAGDLTLTALSVCQDFLFKGLVDITQHDTLANVFGVKVPLNNGANVIKTYEASNGRVYVIEEAKILYREKIKPVIIEGEDYYNTADDYYVSRRYRSDASGGYDVHVSCRTAQRDTIWALDSANNRLDSFNISNRVFQPRDNSDAVQANINNFWLGYTANVHSTEYEIYYEAYDDINTHYSNPQQVMRLEQKLFISTPDDPKGVLYKEGDLVRNNVDADATCFVGEDRAGVHKLTRLNRWMLNRNNQTLLTPLGTYRLSVPNSGVMTLWLCNTTRSTTAREQGMMFLDYIMLKPVLPYE